MTRFPGLPIWAECRLHWWSQRAPSPRHAKSRLRSARTFGSDSVGPAVGSFSSGLGLEPAQNRCRKGGPGTGSSNPGAQKLSF